MNRPARANRLARALPSRRTGSLLEALFDGIGGEGMSTTANRHKKLWRWGSGEHRAKEVRAGMGAVAQPEVYRADAFVVAAGPGYEVKLVHIRRGMPPGFRTECAADILCLDLQEFGLPETIAWVRAALAHSPGDSPCIAVLGREEELSREELWHISTELEPAGALFHAWPEGCRSFGDAFNALATEISKTYGSPIIHDSEVVGGQQSGAFTELSRA